ncbi:MAG: SRPBCC family protein [Rhodospirillaceae bacterium]
MRRHAGTGSTHASRKKMGLSAAAVAIGVVALGVTGAVLLARRRDGNGPADSAPGRTRRGARKFGDYAVVGRTVTINRPRKDLYAFWRNFRNLARFMENVEKVDIRDTDVAEWTISAPAGTSVKVVTKIVQEREGELIAWRSLPESEIETEGRVAFRDAPGGRGTCVEAIVAYKPPAGELGRLVAKLFQREPNIQGRREMKRFKMLMETGEVATAVNRNAA